MVSPKIWEFLKNTGGSSTSGIWGAEGPAETDGDAEGEGLLTATDGEAETEGDADTDGEIDGEILPPADGLTEGLTLADGEADALGETLGLML